MRSLEGLRQVRRRVEMILKMNNIQVDLQYQIQGRPSRSKSPGCRRRSGCWKPDQRRKGQLAAMLTDDETKTKRTLLGNEEKQASFIEKMTKKIEELKAERDKLLDEIASIRKS